MKKRSDKRREEIIEGLSIKNLKKVLNLFFKSDLESKIFVKCIKKPRCAKEIAKIFHKDDWFNKSYDRTISKHLNSMERNHILRRYDHKDSNYPHSVFFYVTDDILERISREIKRSTRHASEASEILKNREILLKFLKKDF